MLYSPEKRWQLLFSFLTTNPLLPCVTSADPPCFVLQLLFIAQPVGSMERGHLGFVISCQIGF